MDLQETINALAQRVARLEATRPQRRVHNQQQVAAIIGKSVSWLQNERKQGRGPKWFKQGRTWACTDEGLAEYQAELAAQAD
jgi:hypothetical protein